MTLALIQKVPLPALVDIIREFYTAQRRGAIIFNALRRDGAARPVVECRIGTAPDLGTILIGVC